MIGTDSYHIVIDLANPNNKESTSDYRYSGLQITCINNTKKKPLKMSRGYQEPIMAKFLGEGIVRLYREFELEPEELDNPTPEDKEKGTNSNKLITNPGDETMLSIVSIPSYFTATDLLGFIGEKYMSHITHIRILKSDRPNRFLVLLKFNDLLKTAEFQYIFDGKSFNSMEPETCHVIFVKSITLNTSNPNDKQLTKTAKDSLIPFLLVDPFTSPMATPPASPNPSKNTSNGSSSHSKLLELPTCPVCLERMDANITGLLTIPCQHTFHCQCLSKWRDDTCPVCRYSNNVSNQKVRRSIRRLLQYNAARMQNNPASTINSNSDSTGSSSISSTRLNSSDTTGSSLIEQASAIDNDTEVCTECSATDNLWICLICGNIGCSRYAPEQHSLKHFVNTGHCFAMEMNTSRVWDYAGDNYVHRLVANESDGKLVELPDKNSGSESKDKVDEVGFEYSQLLISQLASQQEYYEALLTENRNPGTNKSRRGSSITEIMNSKVITDLEVKIDELSEQVNQLNSDVIPAFKTKIRAKDNKINELHKELNESRIFSESLSNKVEFLTNTNKDLQAQNQDLSEQVKDLMFFLESQEKFKDEPQDVKDGTVLIQPDPKSKNKKNTKKKK